MPPRDNGPVNFGQSDYEQSERERLAARDRILNPPKEPGHDPNLPTRSMREWATGKPPAPEARTEIRIGWRATAHTAIGVAAGMFLFYIVSWLLALMGLATWFGAWFAAGRAIGGGM